MRTRFLIALAMITFVATGSAAAAATLPKNTSPPTIAGKAQQGET